MTSSLYSLGNAIRITILIGLLSVLFVFVQSCQRPATGLEVYSKGSLKKLTARENPPLQPTTRFMTQSGDEMTLGDMRGKVVLVNVWATWCPPCIKEMPSLDNLQKLRGGEDFQVVTISIDRTAAEPAKFFETRDIQNLGAWHDSSYGIPGELVLRGYPTSVFYNAAGREIGILEGDAEWDSPEALALVDYLTSK